MLMLRRSGSFRDAPPDRGRERKDRSRDQPGQNAPEQLTLPFAPGECDPVFAGLSAREQIAEERRAARERRAQLERSYKFAKPETKLPP